jgi:hypothetical protein
MSPAKLCTNPMHVMQIPHQTIMIGRKMLGRIFLRRTLVKGSKSAYETKKMVRVALY